TLTRELIAAGASAAVVRLVHRGHLEQGGGEAEIAVAAFVRVEGGQTVDVELFEDSALEDALARFEEIGAQTEPERLWARSCRALNARDWEVFGECFAEDFELVDRRQLSWEPLYGAQAMVELNRSWEEITPDGEARFEVLAGDDEYVV